MGKGNRARIQRAQDKLDRPQMTVETNKAPKKWVSTVIILFIVGILVASLALNAVYSSGMLMRGSAVMTSENYTVSGTMLTYFFRTQYGQFVNTYGSYASAFGLNTQQSLKSQPCSMIEDGTWFDYFMNSTTAYLNELLICCEYAKANGLELDADDEAEIDEAIADLNETAFENNYTLNGYLRAMYGSGVNEKDIRNCMELVLLANKAAVHANDNFKGVITEDEINTYYNEHPESFLFADYLIQSFEAELATLDKDDFDTTEAYDAAVAEAKAEYETAKADALAKAKEYESLKGYDAFMDKLTADITAQYDGHYDDNESLTEEEREEKERKDIEADLAAASVEDYAYQDPNAEDADELDKWLFAEGRKTGDIKIIEVEDEDEGTYTAYAYCVTAPAAREEYTAANVAYALFETAQTAAVADADALKNKLIADGVLTKEAFEAAAKEQELTYAGVLENLLMGQFGYDEADDYIFSPDRKAGDCEVVKCGDTYLAVILYLGEGDVAWHATATNGVLNEKMTAWYEDLAETYTVNVKEKALNRVNA